MAKVITNTPGEVATTGYPQEEEEGQGTAGILASILGLGGSIAGAIPTFVRRPETDMRGGQAAAREAGNMASRAAVGAAGAGHGRTRGLALREGLRAGTENVARAANIAAQSGERASVAETQLEAQLQQDRLATALRLGAGLGSALGLMGTTRAQALDQGSTPETPVEAPQSPVQAAPAQTGTQVAPEPETPQTASQGPGMGLRQATGLEGAQVTPPAPTRPGEGEPAGPLATNAFTGLAPMTPEDRAVLNTAKKQSAQREYARAGAVDRSVTPAPGDASDEAASMDSIYQFLVREVTDGRMQPEQANVIYQNALMGYQRAAQMEGVRNAEGIMYMPSFEEHQAMLNQARGFGVY